MDNNSITVSELVDTQYREFARYTCFKRAIPSMVDSFKPSQRKAFYILKGKQKLTKVMALAGEMISSANYNHGDASACDTIVKMSQDYTGSNNIPPFLNKGTFGNKLMKDASAPRYIYSRPNKKFYSLYKDYELMPSDSDLDNPEPYYYLPVIPTLLLNGVHGIAVGFATTIQPYNIKDIIKYIQNKLNGVDNTQSMVPYYKDFKGKIFFDTDKKKYVMRGVYKKVNTSTIKVSSVPINMDRETYITYLVSLIDKNMITSYVDNSDDDWNITIKLPRNSQIFDDPYTLLKLDFALQENITVLDEDRKIKVFDDIYGLMDQFIDFRLGIYDDRKKYMIKKIVDDGKFNKAKIQFIKLMGTFDFKSMTKEAIRQHIIENSEIKEEYLDKLLDLKVYRLSNDEIEVCKENIKKLREDYKWYKKISIEELYHIDLEEILKIYV